MGTIAARKAGEIQKNVRRVLAMEMMGACQAIDLTQRAENLGRGTAPAYATLRSVCAYMEDDRPLYEDINRCEAVLPAIVHAVEQAVGTMSI